MKMMTMVGSDDNKPHKALRKQKLLHPQLWRIVPSSPNEEVCSSSKSHFGAMVQALLMPCALQYSAACHFFLSLVARGCLRFLYFGVGALERHGRSSESEPGFRYISGESGSVVVVVDVAQSFGLF